MLNSVRLLKFLNQDILNEKTEIKRKKSVSLSTQNILKFFQNSSNRIALGVNNLL